MAINVFWGSLILASLIFSILCFVFLCVWIYRDAKSRGQSGLVWILISLFSSPIIGLLAYLLAGRKDAQVSCRSCGWMISQNARFCERCGTEQPPVPSGTPEKRTGFGLIVFSSICFVLAILCVVGVLAATLTGNGFSPEYPSPTVNVMSVNTMWNGEWKIDCYYCNDGYLKKDFTLNSPQDALYSNVTCEEGQIFLHVHQGDKKVLYDLTGIQGEFRLPMEEFQPGKIRVMVEVRDIKGLKSLIRLE